MSLSITKNISDKTEIILDGRLDTTTAPELEAVLEEVLPSTKDLVLDFAKLEYISSAGLRLVLKSKKSMDAAGGTMKLVNVCDEIMEVFDITGFSDFLTIE